MEETRLQEKMLKGIVKWFDVRKGFGFITSEEGVDYFVHYSQIQMDGFRKLKADQEVMFDPKEEEDGRLSAEAVIA